MDIDNFIKFIDTRGSLLPIELDKIPFKTKRIFVVNDVPINCTRGNHAHYKTKQYILCVNGEIEVILNYGFSETKIILKSSEGLLIDKMIWDSQKFLTENATLLVFCSTNYNTKDYIYDYNEFKKIISLKQINGNKKKTNTRSSK